MSKKMKFFMVGAVTASALCMGLQFPFVAGWSSFFGIILFFVAVIGGFITSFGQKETGVYYTGEYSHSKQARIMAEYETESPRFGPAALGYIVVAVIYLITMFVRAEILHTI